MDYDKLKSEYLQSAAPLIVRRDELIKQLPNLRKCDCFEVSKRIRAINEELDDMAATLIEMERSRKGAVRF